MAILYGTLSDQEQQQIVEDFGRDEAPVRLLIASDVAAEGINLHYLSHRMIHFDIPWSLMIFQQRNGRIDRYGQERTPEIVYLVTESCQEKIHGDTRILELLIRKDEEAVKNIGDPASFMGVYDIEEEEKITARAMEQGFSPEKFEENLKVKAFDPLALLLGEATPPSADPEVQMKTTRMSSLFQDDFTYLHAAIQYLRQAETIQAEFYHDEQQVVLTAPEDLRHRFRFLPGEIWPDNGVFILSKDTQVIQSEIKQSRKEERAWPRIHYLWELNPVMEWINDKIMAAFGRHEAPVIIPEGMLQGGEVVFLLSGLIPNLNGQPLVHRWFGVSFINGRFQGIEEFAALLKRTGLGQKPMANRGEIINLDPLRQYLPEAVEKARAWMSEQRKGFEARLNEKLDEHLKALELLRVKHGIQLELRFSESRLQEKTIQSRKEKEQREIDCMFDDYLDWVQNTMTTENNPYIQVIAVLKGAD